MVVPFASLDSLKRNLSPSDNVEPTAIVRRPDLPKPIVVRSPTPRRGPPRVMPRGVANSNRPPTLDKTKSTSPAKEFISELKAVVEKPSVEEDDLR